MLFDKPSQKTTGRIKFYGTTPCGREVYGHFFRIYKNTFQIKAGKFWRQVSTVYLSKADEKNV